MRRLLAIFLTFLAVSTTIAQEKSIEIKINGEAADPQHLWKATLLIIFILIILILAIRTFRGKSSV